MASERSAILTLYTEDNMPEGRFGYVAEIKAVCTINHIIEGFTVYQSKPLLWGKTTFRLYISLPNVKTGRAFGHMYFDTLDEAVEFGNNIMRKLFPVLDEHESADDIQEKLV